MGIEARRTRVFSAGAATLLLAMLWGVVSGCGSTVPEGPVQHSVLFIGNSLTYENDLPGRVRRLFASQGVAVHVAAVALPNYSLEDHWNHGPARARLRSGDWDFVVLQQGPSSREESRRHLRAWAKRFADEARSHDARPVLMTVWPAAPGGDLPRVVESYRLAAEDCGCGLAPAGRIWMDVLRIDPRAPLHGPDRFHPSVEGTELAALAVVGAIDPDLDLPGLVSMLEVDPGRRDLYRTVLASPSM